MSDNSNKPWSIAQFEQNRPHMTDFVRNKMVPIIEDGECRPLVIRAPVKSGKREIAEYTAMRDESVSPLRRHALITGWHRVADDNQRKELSLHNMKVFSINKIIVADDCIKWISEKLNDQKKIVLHLDECDHGSGHNQILSKVYNYIRNIPQVFPILYSATPEEVLFSNDMNDQYEANILGDIILHGIEVKYIPPPGYCGPSRFLNENLVFDAKPFFRMNPIPALTEQGRQIISDLKHSTATGTGRNILILRLTKKDGNKKEDKDIYKFLKNAHTIPEIIGVYIWVDKSDCDVGNTRNIGWSDRDYWPTVAKDVPILIVHDQTSSRSTEWEFHDRIFATHDYRTSLTYAIISQAQERVNHYDSKYPSGFQPIRIYGHKNTFKLSAGIIPYNEYLEPGYWTMQKVNIRRAQRDNLIDMYEIKNKISRELHPEYLLPLSKDVAENVLKDLGCFDDVSLSTRVKGKISRVPIFNTHFIACNSGNFTERIPNQLNIISNGILNGHIFENPFLNRRRPAPDEDGREKGYLRGWGIFDYDTDIKSQPGWGVKEGSPRLTICYCQDILGVAIRWHTGNFEQLNLLNAYRSMYPSRNNI